MVMVVSKKEVGRRIVDLGLLMEVELLVLHPGVG
jgi:hypothetical protein